MDTTEPDDADQKARLRNEVRRLLEERRPLYVAQVHHDAKYHRHL